jgi:putative ABC transport system permease protein
MEDASFTLTEKLTDDEILQLENKFNVTLEENRYVNESYKSAELKVISEPKKLNLPLLYNGKYISNESEIMVDKYFFKSQKLKLGDILNVLGKKYTVCGVFTTPNTLLLTKSKTDFMADGSKFGYCMVNQKTFENFSKDSVKTDYSVLFTKDNVDEFRKEISKSKYVIEWISSDGNYRISTFDGENEAMVIMSKIAPLFILVISSIIMSVVLSRILKKEYTYIGTFSAMGYKKKEIFIHYLSIPMAISILGSIVGLLVGFLFIEPFSLISSIEYNVPKPAYYINYQDILLILTFPLVLNIVLSAIAIIKALSINIVALLKSSTGKVKKELLLRILPYKKGNFKFRFKLKEVLSNIPRSFLMLTGIIVATMFMMAGFIFYSCIDFVFENNLNKIFGYNYQYILNAPQTGKPTQGEAYISSNFEYFHDGESVGFEINGIPENAKYMKLYDNEGKFIDVNKTVISSSIAKRFNLKKGDIIKLKNISNLKEYEIKIDDICNVKFGNYLYMSMSKLNNMLELPKDTYTGIYSDKKINIDQSIVYDIITKEDNKVGLEVSINTFRAFLYILAGFSATIGIIVIYIVTVMLIEENRKNISMLKVMGYKNREISNLLLNSTSIIVWIGFILSVPITKLVLQKFLDILSKEMFFDFKVILKTEHMLLTLLATIIIYYLTLQLSKRKVLNINMAESLKTRE